MADKLSCWECKHFGNPYCCDHPNNTKWSPVFGHQTDGTADDMRRRADKCGPEAKWFEQASGFRMFWRKLDRSSSGAFAGD